MGREDRQDINKRRRAAQAGLDVDASKIFSLSELRDFEGFDRRGEANKQIDQDKAAKGWRGIHRKGGERDRG